MIRNIIAFLVSSIFFISCSRNSLTGRKQFKLLPESELQTMASDQYQKFLASNKVVTSNTNKDVGMIQRVGKRVSKAVIDLFEQKGLSKSLEGYKWEYNLVDSKEVNAWCMPGGKIVVYSGLLEITQNEAALAVVMGHEVCHAVLQHGNERVSQSLGVQAVGVGLQVAMANKPAETQNIFLGAYGAGAQLGVLLPFSRKHELEADHWGLNFAAMAGYDPNEAIPLWERMEKAGGGQKPPEFLSTHPSEGNRIEQLKKWMPEAMKYYNDRK